MSQTNTLVTVPPGHGTTLEVRAQAKAEKKRVWIVRTETEAGVLMDPMRREILRLLASDSHTGNELSKMLGMSPPTICHHLQELKDQQFIYVERVVPEAHGIVQKFYRANALAFIIDSSRLPIHMRRYFAPMQLERTRGVMGALLLRDKGFDTSVPFLERLCDKFSRAVVEVAEKKSEGFKDEDPEGLITHIYQEALANVMMTDRELFGQESANPVGATRLPVATRTQDCTPLRR